MRIPAPKVLPAFPDFSQTRAKTPIRGGGLLRRRWRGPAGHIAEWDSLHGTLEMYDSRGKHLGEFNHVTGVQLKSTNPSYNIEP